MEKSRGPEFHAGHSNWLHEGRPSLELFFNGHDRRAPQTVAAQELRIECMFPADETTEIHHASMIAASRT
jgi:hypothetical protein